MPKEEENYQDEPEPKRPQRNLKPKVVFDPSDVHIPKRRTRYSYKNEKPTEATAVKKTINGRKKINDTAEPKGLFVNVKLEPGLSNYSSTEINAICPTQLPQRSAVKRTRSSYKNEKPTEATAVKKTIDRRKKINDTAEPKGLFVNVKLEPGLSNYSSTEINAICPTQLPQRSAVKRTRSSYKNEKPTEATAVKKTIDRRKKINDTAEPKGLFVNVKLEPGLSNYSSTEINAISPTQLPQRSAVKRTRSSYKNEKPTEATAVKKTINRRKTKNDTAKSKSLFLKVKLEPDLSDSSSTEINTISPMQLPKMSAVKSVTHQVTQETTKKCNLCSKNSKKSELIDCPVCLIKVHRHCLIIDEPMWKFKLELCPWLCKECRKQNCSICLNDESQCEIERRCITCGVGLHNICYNSCKIKPLQKFKSNVFVCIPCMTLASQINLEEAEKEGEEEVKAVKFVIEENVKACTFNIAPLSSNEEDSDSKSNISDSSSAYEQYNEPQTNKNIPNIKKWTKDEVFEYLKKHLSEEIIHQIKKYNFDGSTLLAIERDYIIHLGLKLGHALKLFKQVRILQMQSTDSRIFWE